MIGWKLRSLLFKKYRVSGSRRRDSMTKAPSLARAPLRTALVHFPSKWPPSPCPLSASPRPSRGSARKVAARSVKSQGAPAKQRTARDRPIGPRPSSRIRASPRGVHRRARARARTLTLPSQSRAQPVKSVRSVKTFAGEGDVAGRLEEALKVRSPRVTRSRGAAPLPGTCTHSAASLPRTAAEDCVGECAAMWDEVEELSQPSDKKPAPAEVEPAPISPRRTWIRRPRRR